MLSQGKELAAIDFGAIIGGPLIATINAQARSAYVTTNFIQDFAFEPSTGSGPAKLKVVDFDYSQVMGNTGDMGGVADSTSIKVPMLTLVPIPFIRIESMTIELNVNLHDVKTSKINNNFIFKSQESGGASYDDWIESAHVNFQTSVTDQNTYQHDQKIDDTYSLQVTVHAVQDQMPGGMNQVLSLFSNVVQQQSALIQTIMTAEIQEKTKAIQAQLKNNSSKPASS